MAALVFAFRKYANKRVKIFKIQGGYSLFIMREFII